MKIVNGKAKFGPNDYELAYEMSENGYPIFINNIGAFGGGCGKVTGMHPRFANNYGDDYEDESENPELADQIVCINKFIGQSSLNWGEWSDLYIDAWTPAEEYENWVERENKKMPKENESFSKGVSKMNITEAKQVLKKNGYKVLSEAEQNPMETLFKDLQKNEGPEYSVEFDKRFNEIWVSFETSSVIIAPMHTGYNVIEKTFDENGDEVSEDEEMFDTIEEVREYLNSVFDLTV